MPDLHYITDEEGRPRAVVLSIQLWRQLLPRENATVEELSEAMEDYCLGKAMDEGMETPLLDRKAALRYLED